MNTLLFQDGSIKGIFQWSGMDMMTKYDMCVAMADALGLSSSHISADMEATAGAPRPYDSRMDNSRLQQLGIQAHTPFKQGIEECLAKWLL